jgi:hypothetical protein
MRYKLKQVLNFLSSKDRKLFIKNILFCRKTVKNLTSLSELKKRIAMNVVGILREANLLTINGLAEIFRHGIHRKEIPALSAALRLTEARIEAGPLELT